MNLPRADGERVRFCMHCNEVVPFGVRVCPACGQFEPQVDDDRGPKRDCAACERPVSATRVLCPHCGRETGLVPTLREPRMERSLDQPLPGQALPGQLALGLALAGPLCLAIAAVVSLA